MMKRITFSLLAAAAVYSSTAAAEPHPNISCADASSVVGLPWFNPSSSSLAQNVADKHEWCSAQNSQSFCSKWDQRQAYGNYVRVFDDPARSKDAAAEAQAALSVMKQNNALDLFKGFVVQVYWGQVETPNGMNFNEIDKVLTLLDQPGNEHMNLILMPTERTFHLGCNTQGVFPSHVKTVAGDHPNTCYAATYEAATSQKYQNFVGSLYEHYKNNPKVIGGIIIEESALSNELGRSPANVNQRFARYVDRAKFLSANYPNMMTLQGINWPNEKSRFESLANSIKDLPGQGLTWPDTVGLRTSNLQSNTAHYQVSKDFYGKLITAGGVQSPFINASKNELSFVNYYLEHVAKTPLKIWERYYSGPDKTPNTYGDNHLKTVIEALKSQSPTSNTACGG